MTTSIFPMTTLVGLIQITTYELLTLGTCYSDLGCTSMGYTSGHALGSHYQRLWGYINGPYKAFTMFGVLNLRLRVGVATLITFAPTLLERQLDSPITYLNSHRSD